MIGKKGLWYYLDLLIPYVMQKVTLVKCEVRLS